MPKLKINRDELIDALTVRFEITEDGWYLDTETGKVLLNSDAADDLPEDIEDNPRYLPIEPIESDESYRIMEDFIATVKDAKAATRLGRAIEGRKPFRRFKDALLDFPALREAWFEFEGAAHARLAEAWCEASGIDVEWV